MKVLLKIFILAAIATITVACDGLYDDAFNGTRDESLLVFAADGNDGGGIEAWVYDGVNHPYRITDINSGGGNSSPSNFFGFNGKLMMVAANGSDGNELHEYSLDGTVTPVSDLNTGGDSFESDYTKPVIFQNKLYVQAFSSGGNQELWEYDGVSAPRQITTFNESDDSTASAKIVYNDKLYFEGNISSAPLVTDYELFAYDGSGYGDEWDINTGPDGSLLDYFCIYNGKLYFAADGNDGDTDPHLWVYDGVSATKVTAGAAITNPHNICVYDDKLYFSAHIGTIGRELCVYDGDSISLAKDINGVLGFGSYPENFTVYKGKLYFSAYENYTASPIDTDTEMYVWDGNDTQLMEIRAGNGSSFPEYFTVFKDKLYFVADNGSGRKLHVFNGTTVNVVSDTAALGSITNLYTWKRHTPVFE